MLRKLIVALALCLNLAALACVIVVGYQVVQMFVGARDVEAGVAAMARLRPWAFACAICFVSGLAVLMLAPREERS